MKNLTRRALGAFLLSTLGIFLSSCAPLEPSPPAQGESETETEAKPEPETETEPIEEIPAEASENSESPKRYRPKNGSWYGHWTPDRAHAEDHLRAHNAETGSSGGVVEYE